MNVIIKKKKWKISCTKIISQKNIFIFFVSKYLYIKQNNNDLSFKYIIVLYYYTNNIIR